MIDAPCGAGKTEYIIRYLNEHRERPFLYISPLRKMFERIEGKGEYKGRGIEGRTIFTPEIDRYNRTKLHSLKEQISVGVDVMSTHALFLRLDDEATDMFGQYDYGLIIDEALDAVTALPTGKGRVNDEEDFVFHDLKQRVTDGNLKWLLEHDCISIDSSNYNRVVWTDKSHNLEHRYEDIERMVKAGGISYVNGTFLIWSFPISVLEAFRDVTILTYRFDSSIFKAYLDFYGKDYEHKTVVREGNDLHLANFTQMISQGKQYANLMNICTAEKLNAIGLKTGRKCPLSYGWYSRSDKVQRKALKNNLTNYFRHYCKADSDSVMWTTYKGHSDSIKPPGYIVRRDGKTPSFVPCNSKATEQFKERYNLAYLIDRYLNPGIEAFFLQKNITVPEDEYALSEFIQWIFRSRISKGEPISLYVPSERMRNLLLAWLGLQ